MSAQPRRWIKTTAIVVGVVFLLLAAIATYLVATFDANRHKSTLVDCPVRPSRPPAGTRSGA